MVEGEIKDLSKIKTTYIIMFKVSLHIENPELFQVALQKQNKLNRTERSFKNEPDSPHLFVGYFETLEDLYHCGSAYGSELFFANNSLVPTGRMKKENRLLLQNYDYRDLYREVIDITLCNDKTISFKLGMLASAETSMLEKLFKAVSEADRNTIQDFTGIELRYAPDGRILPVSNWSYRVLEEHLILFKKIPAEQKLMLDSVIELKWKHETIQDRVQ
jgi:hypothetical protein